jgi:hypothetical protein
LLQAIGATINGLLDFKTAQEIINIYVTDKITPVGTVIQTMLTEAQFLAEHGTSKWVRADGRNVTGSRYHSITGSTNIPDLRGYFIRSTSDNSAIDPSGPRASGSVQVSAGMTHTHAISFNPKEKRSALSGEPTVTQTECTFLEDTNSSGGSNTMSGDVWGDNIVGSGNNGHNTGSWLSRFRRFDATLPAVTASPSGTNSTEARPPNKALTFMIRIN